jgi:hypothetical protein
LTDKMTASTREHKNEIPIVNMKRTIMDVM